MAKRIKTKRQIEKLKKNKPNELQFIADKQTTNYIHSMTDVFSRAIARMRKVFADLKTSSKLN